MTLSLPKSIEVTTEKWSVHSFSYLAAHSSATGLLSLIASWTSFNKLSFFKYERLTKLCDGIDLLISSKKPCDVWVETALFLAS